MRTMVSAPSQPMSRQARRPCRSRALALAVLLTSAWPAGAIRPTPPSVAAAGRSVIRPTPWALQDASDPAWNQARAASDTALSSFAAEAGGRWTARYDRRTDRVAMVFGSGLPWLPGPGNSLSWDDVEGGAAGSPDATLVFLESRARALMARHPGLFRLPAGVTLVVDRNASRSLDAGRIWQVQFRAMRGGVPVAGAGATFRVHSGNLVQFGTSRLTDALSSTQAVPRLGADDALRVAVRTLAPIVSGNAVSAPLAVSEVVNPGHLVIVPLPASSAAWAPGEGLDYRLAWEISFRLSSVPETWNAHVDAVTGDLLGLVDANLYACPSPDSPRGRVVGGVQVGPAEERPIVERTLPHVLVTQGSVATADANGAFAIDPAGPAAAGLTSAAFHVACVSCDAPPQALARNAASVPALSFGFGGAEGSGNGRSTPAERNAYYHLHLVQQLAGGHLADADVGGFFSGHVAMVNLEDTCNGFAASRTTFFLRGDANCRNCAEVPDAVYHEWGHSLDIATFPGPGLTGFDFARSEGMADTIAFLATHDQRIAPYFFRGDSAGLRQADEDVSGMGTMTVANVLADCPAGQGPQGAEPHCEGQVFLQAHWHLGQLLRTKYGDASGWLVLERLFFLSLPLSHAYLPDQTDSAYDAVVLVDDDDGDLWNGTPNGAEILAAFGHHGMASTPPVGDSPECAAPATPFLTATPTTDPATGEPAASLTWTSGPQDARYDVTRNAGVGTEAAILVATLGAPSSSFRDENLGPGVTYRYRVAAFDASGCRSADSNRALVAVPAVPRLEVVAIVIDDAAGDADGELDRGEVASLAVVLENVGRINMTSALATLTSAHAGVAIPRSVAVLPDAAPGAVVATDPRALEVAALRYVAACGERIPFTLAVDGAEGCVTLSFEIVVGGETRAGVFADDFEVDSGWRVDPEGADDATGGIWVREPPRATWSQLQPGADHTASGTSCWVTGNAAGEGVEEFLDDDVDGGCTTVQSPVLPLAGRVGLELSYWRRFHAFGDRGGASLAAEVSNDGGLSWRVLEVVREPSPSWQQVFHDLDAVLGEPADRLVVRFVACDPGPDTFAEALVDDLVVRESAWACGCALTAAPPALGGLLATGRKDEDGAEFAWSAAPLEPDQHYRLVRGATPDLLDVVVTPPDHLATSWDDRAAPGPLYFYSLRAADCLGGEGPD